MSIEATMADLNRLMSQEAQYTNVVHRAGVFIERMLRGSIAAFTSSLKPEDQRRLQQARSRLDFGERPSFLDLTRLIEKVDFMDSLANVESVELRFLKVVPLKSVRLLRNDSAHGKRDFSLAEARLMHCAAQLLVEGLGQCAEQAYRMGGEKHHQTEMIGQGAPDPQLFREAYTRYGGSLRNARGPVTKAQAGPNGRFEFYRQEFDSHHPGGIGLLAWAPGLSQVFCVVGDNARHYCNGHAAELGVPCSDEQPVQSSHGTDGTRQEFRVGTDIASQRILFRHTSGAHKGRIYKVRSGILERYIALQGPESRLGFPISDEKKKAWVAKVRFEGGTMVWYARGKTRVTYNDD